MRVLVTGCGTLLGANLARILLENGFTVRALLDPKTDHPNLEGLPIERVAGDILDPESTQNALGGVQSVFHCASVMVLWPARAEWINAINYDGTRNLLLAMSRTGVDDLVHVGSSTSFGYGAMEEPGNEEKPYALGRLHLSSFDSMRRAQELVEMYAGEGKIRGIIVNPTFAIGSYDSGVSIGKMYARYVGWPPRYYPSGGLNIAWAKDVAVGILKALGRGKSGRSYILGNHNVYHHHLTEKFAEALGVRPPARQIGDSQILLRALTRSAWSAVTRRPPIYSLETARVAVTPLYYDSSRAVSELDLPQSPLEEIIEDACRWYAG